MIRDCLEPLSLYVCGASLRWKASAMLDRLHLGVAPLSRAIR